MKCSDPTSGDDAPAAEELRRLYAETSKHSAYQALAPRLRERVGGVDAHVRSRFEADRLHFIERRLDVRGRTVVDIGANTGYFTFELLERGAASVDCFEGNPVHARFLERAGEVLGVADRLRVHPAYWDLGAIPAGRRYDVGLLLNVLHHVGDDFGNREVTIAAAREAILAGLNRLSDPVRTLVLQVGYCWKGDRNLLLFESGTKREQIDFVSAGTEGYWAVEAIGIAELEDGAIVYREPTPANLARRDDLGEFLNRPLFILRSLRT